MHPTAQQRNMTGGAMHHWLAPWSQSWDQRSDTGLIFVTQYECCVNCKLNLAFRMQGLMHLT